MDRIKKQSDFSRTKANDAKMGAYYTDVGHCASIGRFLQFPEDGEVCCLEPSIGDGKAVLAVTGKDREERPNIKIFGVELNEDTHRDVSRNKDIHICLKADFTTDVTISQSSFSFLFMNPPYGTQENGERYELVFLRKAMTYLSKGAVAVVVVARYMAEQREFLKEWCGCFSTEHLYRFREKEYERFQQVVLIGRKKERSEKTQEEEDHLYEMVSDKEKIPVLPEDYSGKRLMVPKSHEMNIGEFMTRVFHVEEAAQFLTGSPLQELAKERIRVSPYIINNLGRPPIIPSEGQMYLLAVSGAGQGLVGSEENGDLHLQRGVSKIATRSEYVEDEDGAMKEVVTSFPKISFNLIESDGTIQTL